MRNKDFIPRFQQIMLCATEIYAKEISVTHAKIFLDLVKDFDISDIENSFRMHMQESKFFPTPADIIERIPRKNRIKTGDLVLVGGESLRVLN